MDNKKKRSTATKLIHSGDEFNKSGAIVPPIVHSVNFAEKSVESLARTSAEYRPLGFYTRYNHPLSEQIGSIVSSLEKTEDAIVLGSGMAAISTAIISSVKAGDHIVAQNSLYAGTLKLLRDILPSFPVKFFSFLAIDIVSFSSSIIQGPAIKNSLLLPDKFIDLSLYFNLILPCMREGNTGKGDYFCRVFAQT